MKYTLKTVKGWLCVGMALVLTTLFSACDVGRVHVALNETACTVSVGETVTLAAVASDGSDISWSSGNEEVATVSDGVVTGVSVGTAVITASCPAALATCTVTVVASSDSSGGDSSAGDSTGSDSSGSDSTGGDSTGSDSSGSDSTGSDSTGSDSTGGDSGGEDTPGQDDDIPVDGVSLVWQDEFSGTALDRTKWNYQTGTQDNYYGTPGPAYWGNDELQYYTEDAVRVENGSLVITAQRRQMGDRQYTSARILTRDLASFTYGYFEARMRTPAIDGMWPAFWMLPQPTDHSSTNNVYGGWAANGEIDIMEAKGRLQNVVDTTLHFGGGWPTNTYRGGSYPMATSTEEWHTYGLDWQPDRMTWYVDGVAVYSVTSDVWYSEAAPDNDRAPFDQPFYILFDLAVGGRYDNYVNPPADFTSASMYVDYVRVYQ